MRVILLLVACLLARGLNVDRSNYCLYTDDLLSGAGLFLNQNLTGFTIDPTHQVEWAT